MTAFNKKMTETANSIRRKTGSIKKIKITNFPTEIDEISGESVGMPNPYTVYEETRPNDWLKMPTPNNNEIYMLFHILDGSSGLIAFTVTCSNNSGYKVELGTTNIDSEDNIIFIANDTKTQTLSNNTKYENEIFASDWDDLTAEGFKQVIIKISLLENNTENITKWEISNHSKKTILNNSFADWNVVEFWCNLPSGQSVKCGYNSSENKSLKKMRYFAWFGSNNLNTITEMFCYCNNLIAILELDYSKIIGMSNCFKLCENLITFPICDTPNLGYFNNAFYGCQSLTLIPSLNTSKVTISESVFLDCRNLKEGPDFDLSKTTSTYRMFFNCFNLKTVPQYNTSNITNMRQMFYMCNILEKIPLFDTSKVTNMNNMFEHNFSLKTIPAFDTSNVIDMSSMFSSCGGLITIPKLNTSKVTTMENMFNGCYNLIKINLGNTANVTNMDNMFTGCYSLEELTLEPTIENWEGCNISIENCNLNKQKLVQLFNSLPTITTTHTLNIINNVGTSELTESDKAIAIGKGWNLITE